MAVVIITCHQPGSLTAFLSTQDSPQVAEVLHLDLEPHAEVAVQLRRSEVRVLFKDGKASGEE